MSCTFFKDKISYYITCSTFTTPSPRASCDIASGARGSVVASRNPVLTSETSWSAGGRSSWPGYAKVVNKHQAG